MLRRCAAYLLVAILCLCLLILPIRSAQQNAHVISSQGIINGNKSLGWLHTDGKYIKDADGNIVHLYGATIIEPAYIGDHLRYNQPISQRIATLKSMGINFVRLIIDRAKWDANVDTNGDGIGNRNFTIQVGQALSDAGIMFVTGIMGAPSEPWPQDQWASYVINNMIMPFEHMSGFVGVFILNEPHTEQWGGINYDSVSSVYWDSAKYVCAQIHAHNPNILIIVHANGWSKWGFSNILKTDPIPTPNVCYTFHYYFGYAPQMNPYLGWMSGGPKGVLDSNYEELVNRGMPFYKSYYQGNYTLAKQQLEQYFLTNYFWAATDYNLPIVNDEWGFSADEEGYFSWRECPTDGCTWIRGRVADTLLSPRGTPAGVGPYPAVTYCPQDGTALPKPHDHVEPGWPQCFLDQVDIFNKYMNLWANFAFWPKTYSGYGIVQDDMTTLAPQGVALKEAIARAVGAP